MVARIGSARKRRAECVRWGMPSSWRTRAAAATCFLLLIVLGASASVGADGVSVAINEGRVSVMATNATVGEILDAWSRAGQTSIDFGRNSDEIRNARL